MNEKIIEKVLEAVKRINKKNGRPVKLSTIANNGIVYNGRKLLANERRNAIAELLQRGLVKEVKASRKATAGYIPIEQTVEVMTEEAKKALEIYGAMKFRLKSVKYFEHDPTPEEVMNFIEDGFCQSVTWFIKTHVLTREGAIARQILERIHFSIYVMNPRVPVKKRYALTADPNDIIPSTLEERRAALNSLIDNGFVKTVSKKLIIAEPIPSFQVYKRKEAL